VQTPDYATALAFGNLVEAAYAYTAPYIAPAGYRIIKTIWGNDWNIAEDQASYPVRFGFILEATDEPRQYVVAMRGTQGIWEWLQDGDFVMRKCTFAPGEVSSGFTNLYTSLQTGDDKGADGTPLVKALVDLLTPIPGVGLTIAGHSLGGALANMLSLDYASRVGAQSAPTLYTYASPNFGDLKFVQTLRMAVTKMVVVVNANDVVPNKPPTWLPVPSVVYPFYDYYANVPPTIPLRTGSSVCNTWACNHSMMTYLYLLAEKLGLQYPLAPGCAAPCGQELGLPA
jgi:hypothetical protein